jgi:hypothetical protein
MAMFSLHALPMDKERITLTMKTVEEIRRILTA